MGDMADFSLEETFDFEDMRTDYHMGNISEPDAYEAGIVDELGREYSPRSKKFKTCRCCGKGGLTWGEYRGKWRLFDGEALHQCSVNPLR